MSNIKGGRRVWYECADKAFFEAGIPNIGYKRVSECTLHSSGCHACWHAGRVTWGKQLTGLKEVSSLAAAEWITLCNFWGEREREQESERERERASESRQPQTELKGHKKITIRWWHFPPTSLLLPTTLPTSQFPNPSLSNARWEYFQVYTKQLRVRLVIQPRL